MNGILEKSKDVAGRRKRLTEFCESLKGAVAERAGLQHLAFKSSKKVFAYYAYDHHGDGRIALLCKAPPGEQERLVAEDGDRYFTPPYVGSRGWIGLRLDGARINWKEIENLIRMAHAMTEERRSSKRRP